MEHAVFFPAPDGTPAFRRLPSLEEAVRLVEHLRNVEGVSSVSVQALTEVPLSFRAYYRVERPGVEVPAAIPPEAAVADVEVPEPVPSVEPPALALVQELPVQELPVQELPVQEQPEPAMATSNGHATPASLGFFA